MNQNNGLVVIFSTFNGGEVLRRSLEGYTRQAKPRGPWRMIVVNNNSTDNTAEILQEFSEILPLKTIFVGKPGKNTALNRALDELGPQDAFIVLTDDDAIPQDKFLTSWADAFLHFRNDDLFAGKVVPHFVDTMPDALKDFEDHFEVLYAKNDREEGVIEARSIYGPNMGVRRSVFDRGIRFNENIGPSSQDKMYPMGSETEFCVRATQELGLVSRFVAGPSVFHQVREKQTTLRFVAERAYRHGRGFALQNGIPRGAIFQMKFALRLSLLKIKTMLGLRDGYWNYNWFKGYLSFRKAS